MYVFGQENGVHDKIRLLMGNDERKNLTKTQLRIAARLSTSTFAKLTKNEMVSLDVLVRLCDVLECQLSDICTIDFEERV